MAPKGARGEIPARELFASFRVFPGCLHHLKGKCSQMYGFDKQIHAAARQITPHGAVLVTGSWRVGHAARQIARTLRPGQPFRAPHYTAGLAAMLGEVQLAAGGTLYLDEAIEFSRDVLRRTIDAWAVMYPADRPLLVIGVPVHWRSIDIEYSMAELRSVWRGLERIAPLLPPITAHIATDTLGGEGQPGP